MPEKEKKDKRDEVDDRISAAVSKALETREREQKLSPEDKESWGRFESTLERKIDERLSAFFGPLEEDETSSRSATGSGKREKIEPGDDKQGAPQGRSGFLRVLLGD